MYAGNMKGIGLWACLGMAQVWAGEMPKNAEVDPDMLVKRPERVEVPLRERLDAERRYRLETARKNFDRMKADSAKLDNQDYQIGAMLAPVLMDDPRFFAEVLDAWFPAAEADKSAKQMAAFVSGLVSGGGARDVDAAMATLRLLDLLWDGSPPPVSPGSGDPIGLLWNALRSKNPKSLEKPELWRQAAALPPKIQARLWVKSASQNGPDFATDPELVETLRDAAKDSKITRAAFEWHLLEASVNRGSAAKVDVRTFLAFPQALKDAGVPPEEFARLVCASYTWTTFIRLENPGALIAETPVVLDGLQTLPGDLGDAIIEVLAACEYLRFKDEADGDIEPSGAARFGAVEPLLKWVLTRVPESSLSSISGSQMTPDILKTDDASLLDLWVKALGKAGAGNVPLIVGLLEKGRVAQAVALDPLPGQGLYSPGGFTARLEQLVARLRSDPSLPAFHLAVRLSMLDDAASPEAPVESKAGRQDRLTAEFERIREGLSVEDRADFHLTLGVSRVEARGHAPALDEYAGEAAAREFRTMLSSGRRSATAGLYVNSACSRAIAGDLSGVNEITSAIDSAPIGVICDEAIECHVLRPVVGCFVTHANNTDVRLPKATVDAILGFAKALAGRQTLRLNGAAARLVYLATNDDASLAAGLKHCGLVGVKPAVPGASDGFTEMSATMLSIEIRVALRHPSFSKTLLTALSEVWVSDDGSPLVPLLGDPKLRAGIAPNLFIHWNSRVRRVTPEGLESMKLYINERHGEFDVPQRIATEDLMYRLENPKGRSERGYYDRLRNSPWEKRPGSMLDR